MKVAIVHYWLTTWRGGERVVEQLLKIYPQADVYTHVADAALVAKRLPGQRVIETFIARLPFGRKRFRSYLMLMPWALENLDLQAYDLVISSESGPAKGIIKRPDALHVCYCHSPMRYLWDLSYDYQRRLGFAGTVLKWLAPLLRVWDVTTATRVDEFVANSSFVAGRIESYYRRPSTIIHPPVNVGDSLGTRDTSAPYYVVAGELIGYKRVDLAVQAAVRLGRRLVVVGAGEQFEALRAIAGPTVEFHGRVDDDEFRRWIGGARALLFPGLEDFGMVPIEALAQGTPLIAYARGGASDYLLDGINGVGFTQQDLDGLVEAMNRFERIEQSFDRPAIRANALRFGEERFRDEFRAFVARHLGPGHVQEILHGRAMPPRYKSVPDHEQRLNQGASR